MAEPPNPAHGAVAVLSEKEALGKLQPSSREPPGPVSAKRVRTEEKKAPRRVNGEGGSGRQLQPPAAPSPQSYGSPAAWSFAALSAAAAASSSPASSRSCFSFSASPAVSSASAAQPVPRKLLVAPSLLHAQPHRVLLPAAAAPAAAKPRRPKEKREKEKRRHGLGGAARDENGEAKPPPPPPPLPRARCGRSLGRAMGILSITDQVGPPALLHFLLPGLGAAVATRARGCAA